MENLSRVFAEAKFIQNQLESEFRKEYKKCFLIFLSSQGNVLIQSSEHYTAF